MILFTKKLIEKFNLSKFTDTKMAEFSKLRRKLVEEVLKNELRKYKSPIIVTTDIYLKPDRIDGDWYIELELKENYKKKFKELLDLKINILKETIKLEIKILNYKLDNIKEYVNELNENEKRHYEQWEKILKESKNVSLEGGLKLKEYKEKEVIKGINLLINYLNGKKITKKEFKFIEDYAYHFLEIISIDFHPITHNFFRVKEYLENIKEYKQAFYDEYGVNNKIIKEKNISIEDTLNSLYNRYLLRNREIETTINNNTLLLTDIIVEDYELETETYNSLYSKKENGDLYEEEIKDYKEMKKIFDKTKKEIYNIPGTKRYIVKKSSIKNLYTIIEKTIINLYKLNKEDIESLKEVPVYIKANYLNY